MPSMIHTLSVSPSALTSPLSPPLFDPPAQAVSPNAAVASTATGSKRFFIDASSLKISAAQTAPGKVNLEVVFDSDAGFASYFRNRDRAAIRGRERNPLP